MTKTITKHILPYDQHRHKVKIKMISFSFVWFHVIAAVTMRNASSGMCHRVYSSADSSETPINIYHVTPITSRLKKFPTFICIYLPNAPKTAPSFVSENGSTATIRTLSFIHTSNEVQSEYSHNISECPLFPGACIGQTTAVTVIRCESGSWQF